jgi:hypothetical protein
MITKFLFTCLSNSMQVKLIRKRGIMLGTRKREGRQIYTYMFGSLFAEIIYQNENPRNAHESIVLIAGLQKLNDHIEKELRLPQLR